jgi:hypothetical protein
MTSPVPEKLANRKSKLSLPLFVLRVDANYPNHAAAMDHLAFVANLLYRRPYFHYRQLPFLLRERPG